MIDLHCHILPGIDDGPATVAEALALARASVAAGTTKVLATPHVSPGYPENTSLRIATAAVELNKLLAMEAIPLRVVKGSELAVVRAEELDDGELGRLRLGTGPWLLTECPMTATSDEFEFRLLALADRGFRLLLAHPERIAAFRKEPALLARLVDQGMLCQLTASALAGRFGKEVQRFSWTLVEEGLVHVVASDAHGAERRRPNVLGHLRAQGCPETWIDWWTDRVPTAILSGAPIPPGPGTLPRRPGGRGFLRRG